MLNFSKAKVVEQTYTKTSSGGQPYDLKFLRAERKQRGEVKVVGMFQIAEHIMDKYNLEGDVGCKQIVEGGKVYICIVTADEARFLRPAKEVETNDGETKTLNKSRIFKNEFLANEMASVGILDDTIIKKNQYYKLVESPVDEAPDWLLTALEVQPIDVAEDEDTDQSMADAGDDVEEEQAL